MTVLVAFASKHGATEEIADAIGDSLRERSVDTNVLAVEDVTTLEIYDAVVLGSAIYAGHWRAAGNASLEEPGEVMCPKTAWVVAFLAPGGAPHPTRGPV